MTDLENITIALAEPEVELVRIDGAWYRHILTLAETGALLAEVERRLPESYTEIDYGGDTVHVSCVSDADADQGSGPTLTAALRDLLGVDGG